MFQDGTLYEVTREGQMWHPPDTYCVEMLFNENYTQPRLSAGVCFQDGTTDDSPLLYTAYAVGEYPYNLATTEVLTKQV